jgi:hypothetical protein
LKISELKPKFDSPHTERPENVISSNTIQEENISPSKFAEELGPGNFN